MSRVLTLAESTEQYVELLPARTVLSLFVLGGAGGGKGDDLGTTLVKFLGLSGSSQGNDGVNGTDHTNSGVSD